MKKKIFTLLFTAGFCTMHAQSLFEETFSQYPDKSAVETAAISAEEQGRWTVSCKADEATGKSPLVYDNSLSYAGYRLSEQGKTLHINADDQIEGDVAPKRNTVCRAILDRTPTTPEDGNVVYTAFMVNFQESGSTSGADLFTYFRQGNSYTSPTFSSSTMRGIVRYKIEDGQISFCIRKNSSVPASPSWSTPVDKNQTILLVVKRICASTSSTGANDQYELIVNPDLEKNEDGNSSRCVVAADNNTGGGADLRHICFRQMGSSKYQVGGVSIAKSFSEALLSTSNNLSQTDCLSNIMYADKGKLVVQAEKGSQIEIFNLAGKKIAGYKTQDNQTAISSLPKGIYLVRLFNNTINRTSKILLD